MSILDIRNRANDIYVLLSQRGKLSIRNIGELTNNKESSIYISLGWLLKEQKVKVIEHSNDYLVEIVKTFNETYYG